MHFGKGYRCWPIYALAASIPISMAAISLFKLTVLVVALWLLLRRTSDAIVPYPWDDKSTIVVIFMLGALAFSLTYTTAPWHLAANDLTKYAKLLLIVLIPFLISTRKQALTALAFYASSQVFVLLSSWLLAFGIALPWVASAAHFESNSVFHLYLHQSIMTAGFAVLCWYLRHELNVLWFRVLASILCVMALINVMLLLPGRSGYAAAITVIFAAMFWQVRTQWRWLALFFSILMVGLVLETSTQFKSRVQLVASEARAYQAGISDASSTGWRLNFWHQSARAIVERPLTGFGAGSWVQQYRRLNAGADSEYQQHVGNPHQEFLLWGVMLGVGGVGLMIALLTALWLDARKFALPQARALRSIVLILAVTALFNSVLYDGVIGDYFCAVLGLLLALGKAHRTAGATATPMAELRAGVQA